MMRRSIICILVVFCTFSVVYAQIDPTVEVSRAYKGQLSEISKPQMKTSVADSLRKFEVSFDYSSFDRPYLDLYEFVPYQMTSLDKAVSVRHPFIVAKIGAQYPLMPDASIYAQFAGSPMFNASVYAIHTSLFDDLKVMKGNLLHTSRMNNHVGANVRAAWNTGEVNADVSYRMANVKDSHSADAAVVGEHNVSGIDFMLNAKSAYKEDNSIFYNVDLKFNNTHKQALEFDTKNNENMLEVAANVGASFEDHRVYVNIRTKNEWLAERENSVFGVVEITPMYEYRNSRVKAKIGVKFGNKYGLEEKTDIYPDVRVRVEAIKKKLWVRASFTGKTDFLTISDVAYDLPWIMQDIRFSRVPLNIEIAAESVLWGSLAVNAIGAFAMYEDGFRLMPEYTANGFPVLRPIYNDYRKYTGGVDVSWKSQALTINGSFRYNGYTTDSPAPLYMLPAVETSANVEYNYRKRIFVSAGLSYESYQSVATSASPTGTIPAYIDLSCRADYMINRHIAIYVKGGNLFNRENYRYSGIPSEKINFGGGVCLNF